MKCHKPGTDQEASLTVYTNGFPCPEFALPFSTSSETDTLECFIPVTEGDQLAIHGYFNGTILHGSFDLLADGSFVADKRVEGLFVADQRVEGLKTAQLKYYKRGLDFDKAFDTPRPPGYTSIYTPRSVEEGHLHVKELKSAPPEMRGDKLGVGSLAIIMSVNQECEEDYHDKYLSTICGEWKNVEIKDTKNGGIVPTQELEVKIFDKAVNKNRQAKHRRHFGQTRFGVQPWAKFIFYYRPRWAIEAAGCMPRGGKSQMLEPAAPGSFVCASVENSTTSKSDTKQMTERKKVVEDGDEIAVKSKGGNFTTKITPPPAPMEAPKKKKKLMGQSLFMTSEPAIADSSSEIASVESKTPFGDEEDVVNGRSDEEHDVNEHSDEASASESSTEEGNARHTAGMGDDLQMEDDDFVTTADHFDRTITETQVALEVAPVGGTDVRDAMVANPADQTEKRALPTDQTPQLETQVKEEPQKEIVSSTASKSVVNSNARHSSQCQEQQITPQLSAKDAASTATQADVSTTIAIDEQPSLGSAHQPIQGGEAADTQQKTNPSTHGDSNLDTLSAGEQKTIKIKKEPITHPTITQQTSPSTNSIASSSQIPETPLSDRLKRASSNLGESRESTPSKKSKFADLRARKAKLAAEIEQKRQQKLAAQKAMEDSRRAREEGELALEREIEMLEKQNAEEDEELAELGRAREQEEAEMDEMME